VLTWTETQFFWILRERKGKKACQNMRVNLVGEFGRNTKGRQRIRTMFLARHIAIP
jgi:hypothetical protein